jgi:hypothetical protein
LPFLGYLPVGCVLLAVDLVPLAVRSVLPGWSALCKG